MRLKYYHVRNGYGVTTRLVSNFLRNALRAYGRFSHAKGVQYGSTFVPRYHRFTFFLRGFFRGVVGFHARPRYVQGQLNSSQCGRGFLGVRMVLYIDSTVCSVRRQRQPFFYVQSSRVAMRQRVRYYHYTTHANWEGAGWDVYPRVSFIIYPVRFRGFTIGLCLFRRVRSRRLPTSLYISIVRGTLCTGPGVAFLSVPRLGHLGSSNANSK